MNQKLEDFKRELKALLEKYDATLWCDINGDTHGTSMTMTVEVDKKDYPLCNGVSVDKSDLK